MNALDNWICEQFLNHGLDIIGKFRNATAEDVLVGVVTAKNLLPSSELIGVKVVVRVAFTTFRMDEHRPRFCVRAGLIEGPVGNKEHLLSWFGYLQATAKWLPAVRNARREHDIASVIRPRIPHCFETVR
jgi:hypothetical protein